MSWQTRDPYVEEVVPGVHAYVQPDGSWMINNTGWIGSGRAGAVLVDTSSTEQRTRAFLDAVRRSGAGDPAYLVNTHHHPDHTYGNCLVPESTVILGHDACRAEVLAAGLEATRVITTPDYGDIAVRPPQVTFDHRLSLHLDRPVELLHVGPAHTTNDIVVWLPQERVLFAGDVVFAGGQPFLLEGSLQGFPRALAVIRDLDPIAMVPGHGPVVRGAEVAALLDDLTRYVAFVDAIAREGHAAGSTPLETAQAHRDNEFSGWQETERLVGNLHRAWSELDGNPLDHRLRVADAWPDMVAFHGGPIPCHA